MIIIYYKIIWMSIQHSLINAAFVYKFWFNHHMIFLNLFFDAAQFMYFGDFCIVLILDSVLSFFFILVFYCR